MTLTQTIDHTTETLALLLEQFKNKANLAAFLSVFAGKVQEIEDTLFDVLLLRSLETATGAQLDGVGRLVNLERDGRSDVDYRLRLRVEILVLLSQGTCEELYAILVLLVGSVTDITCSEGTVNADLDMEIVDPITNGPEVYLAWKRAKAAGVLGVLAYKNATLTAGPWFAFGPNPPANSGGFGVGAFGTSNLGGFGIENIEGVDG